MPVFSSGKSTVISRQEELDLAKGALSPKLSAVEFDEDGQFFYMTIDRALFSDPVSTIRTVLDAHGYVPNLENVLSCLDSFRFAVYTQLRNRSGTDTQPVKVEDYMPCLTFELPQKNTIGPVLQSFYDEIARYDTKSGTPNRRGEKKDSDKQKLRKLTEKNEKLEEENRELRKQVNDLTRQLSIEQRSLNRASRALDSGQMLPANASLGRIESVDLKRRTAKVKCQRRVIDIPTHLLDRVPDYQARCLVTFDEDDDRPIGIVFFCNTELADLDNRTAELLYVDGKTFKARDSMRTEFQIKAVNDSEADTIGGLRRGDQILISVAKDYVARFSAVNAQNPADVRSRICEQFVLHDISRNPLVAKAANDDQTD